MRKVASLCDYGNLNISVCAFQEVESAVYLLKIQDSDTSDWSRLECNRALQELEYALYSEPPHCANASWSIADLAMLSSWWHIIA